MFEMNTKTYEKLWAHKIGSSLWQFRKHPKKGWMKAVTSIWCNYRVSVKDPKHREK